MSLSQKATWHHAEIERTDHMQGGFAFPLVLVFIALALILLSAVFSPVTLDTAGADYFLVGP